MNKRVIVLAVIILFLLSYLIYQFLQSVPEKSYPEKISEHVKKAKTREVKSILEERQNMRPQKWSRDPFIAGDYNLLDEKVNLQAISLSIDGKAMALIDGKFVRPGERIGNLRIIQIGKDYIVVEKGDLKTVIRLKEEEVKK